MQAARCVRWADGIAGRPVGYRVFQGITAEMALKTVRRRLLAMGVSRACSYCLHDFWRGRAQDLVENGP